MKDNIVEITKKIDNCEDCPDFMREIVELPQNPYEDFRCTKKHIYCEKTGEDLLKNAIGIFYNRFPIPDSCPRLKKNEEKEREL